jgi:hypothetical protein
MTTLLERLRHLRDETEHRIRELDAGRLRVMEQKTNTDRTGEHIRLLQRQLEELDAAIRLLASRE